jgi:hypothetical protein
MDPKSRKLRGFGAKTGAHLELFLNWVGPRVDSKETQGLFNKNTRANRYLLTRAVRSGSSGSDLIWDGSNLARRLRFLRLGAVGHAGRRRRSPEMISRDGAVLNFAEMHRF